MRWQDINKKVLNSIAFTGSIGVVIMIFMLTGSDVSYTNWPDCENGTDCYARFEINESYYRICFNIDDTVSTPQFFKKQSRSRTLWVNTSRYGFVSTTPNIQTELMMGTIKSRGIDQAPDGKWLREVATNDCIERSKTNYLYVKGIKDPLQEVEWKMDLFDIDPVWDAIRPSTLNESSGKYEYQEEGVIITVTMAKEKTFNSYQTITEGWIDGERFGHNESPGTKMKYIVKGSIPHLTDKKGFYYQEKTTNRNTENVKTYRIDFSKECNKVLQYDYYPSLDDTLSSVSFDPQCYFKQIDRNSYSITFLAQTTNNAELIIDDVSTATSILTNMTCETGFCHSNISDIGAINSTHAIVYYPNDVALNPAVNITYDYSGNNNDGAVYGAELVEGMIGTAIETDFDKYGKWGGIDLGDNPKFSLANTNITFIMGLIANTLLANHGSESIVVCKGCATGGGGGEAEYRLDILANGAISFKGLRCVNDGTRAFEATSAAGTIVAGVQYNVAVVFNGTPTTGAGTNGAQVYVDGVEVAAASQSANQLCGDGTQPLELYGRGVATGDASRMFNGTIDEFMLFDTILPPSVIMDIANNYSQNKMFLQATQEFENLNASEDGIEENTLNISINTSNFFGSSINLSVGNATAGGYIYSQEMEFTNGIINNIGVDNASNFTMRFFCYAGNSSDNPFIACNLLDNVTVSSFIEDEAEAGDPATNFTIWDGAAWVDPFDNLITFRCGSTESQCEPENQVAASSQSIYSICNNGTASGNFVYMYLDPICADIDMSCDDDYTYAGATTLTALPLDIHGSLAQDACIDVSCWADFSSPTVGCSFDIYANVTVP